MIYKSSIPRPFRFLDVEVPGVVAPTTVRGYLEVVRDSDVYPTALKKRIIRKSTTRVEIFEAQRTGAPSFHRPLLCHAFTSTMLGSNTIDIPNTLPVSKGRLQSLDKAIHEWSLKPLVMTSRDKIEDPKIIYTTTSTEIRSASVHKYSPPIVDVDLQDGHIRSPSGNRRLHIHHSTLRDCH